MALQFNQQSRDSKEPADVKRTPGKGVNKTLYIREEDSPVWDKARELTGDKLSSFLTQTLKTYVAESEGKAQGFERIVLRFMEDGLPVAKAFMGRWLIAPDSFPVRKDETDAAKTTFCAVATTPKGNFVFFEHRLKNKRDEFMNAEFTIYGSLEEAINSDNCWPAAVREAKRRLGIVVQELDI